jgi:GTP-binding protein
MFVDKVKVSIRAGDGGNGIVSFRQEKFVDKGGPDGGDGGNGGSILFKASRNQNTLASFRFQKLVKADPGKAGDQRRKHGRNGKDQIVMVPVGTVIVDDAGDFLADLTEDGAKALIAKGGKGGFGNAHFTSSTRQAPRIAEKGEPGEAFEATLELKMIADVGLIGLPNAGKSTFLASTSNARPEIADYPFTTLRPNLGVVDVDKDTSLLVADIPGLIEGASEGKGLGDEFLRHVERTQILIHLIDIYQDDIPKAYKTIQQELKSYSGDLSKRPQIVALTKIEGLDDEMIADKLAELRKVVPTRTAVFAISAPSKKGVKELLYKAKELVTKQRIKIAKTAKEEIPVIKLGDDDVSWRVVKTKKAYEVTGRKIERFAARTDFTSSHGLQRLRDIMRKMGITRELKRQGIQVGDSIIINGYEKIEF